jgi:hypothetical protein
MERYHNNVQDQFGNAIGSVTVTVRLVSDGSLATIYSDNILTAKSNPFTSAGDGELFFYAANERYNIFFTGPITDQKDDVILFDTADTVAPTASSGAVGSIIWTYDGGAGGNPGADQFRNAPANLTITSAFYFSDTDLGSQDVQNILNAIPVGGHIVMRKIDDNSQFRVYGIISITDNAGWYQFNVDYLFGDGDTTALTVGDEVTVEFFTSGYVEPGVESTVSDILYWDGGSTSWQASGATIRVNPSAPPLGGRLAFLGTAGFNTSSPIIMNAIGAVSACLDFTFGTTNVNGFYRRFEPSGLDRINYGVRLASVNTDVLTFNLDHEIRVETGATFLIGEKGAAGTDVATYGQPWVKNDVPCTFWFTDDIGGDFPISQPTVLWNVNTQIVQAAVDGISIAGNSANDPTAGGLQDTRILATNNTADPVFEIGFNSVSVWALESYVHGGNIEIRGQDGSGVIQEAMVFDPDGVTSIRAVTNLELLVNETENAILAVANGAVTLYYDSEIKFQTTDEDLADRGTGAMVRHADETLYPVGLNTIPEDAGLDSGNVTLSLNNCAKMFTYNTGTARSLLFNDDSNIRIGQPWALLVGPSAGTLTGDGGTGVQIRWWNGTGWTTTTAAGNITIGVGQYTIWKESDTLYWISGPTLS